MIRFYNFFIFFFFLSGVTSFESFSQKIVERGEITIRNYHQKEYKGSAQNFGIVQDTRGVMYFANNGGVLEYDGVSWRQIRMPNNSIVKALAIDEKGIIYVGAQNELGYLAPDSSGLLSYFSLLKYLPDSLRNFEFIWKVFSTNKGVYFQASDFLFLWKGEKIKVWKPDAIILSNGSYLVNGKLYLGLLKKGLYILNGEDIVPVIDGELFSDKAIADLVPIGNEKIMVVTKEHGVYTLGPDGIEFQNSTSIKGGRRSEKTKGTKIPKFVFSEKTDLILRQKALFNVLKINENLYAFGTQGDGIIIVHKDGYIAQAITKEDGLQDNIIRFQFIDDHGNLWLALDNGIAKIEINSPITFFTDKSGIKGTIEAITRFQGKLYVGTHSGVYYLNTKNLAQNDYSGKIDFVAVPKISMECWDLITFKKDHHTALIAALNDGVFEVMPDNNISLIAKCIPWTLFQSQKDPSRIYIGLDDGLMSLYYDNGKWINEGRVNGISELIFKISEDNLGNLWLGTLKQGVIKLNFYLNSEISALVGRKGIQRDIKIFRYNKEHGLPEGDFIVLKENNGKPLFGTDKGLFRFNEKEERFYLDTIILEKSNRLWGIHRLNTDSKGNLWMVNYKGSDFEVGLAKHLNDSNVFWNSIPFVEVSKGIIHSIYHDESGIVWLGGVDGLYRFDSNVEKDYTIPYNTLVRKVIIGEDSLIFKGTNYNDSGLVSIPQSEWFKNALPFSNNSITLEFAGQSYENESATLYSRYLEGFDKGWSEWKPETKAVYTNLHEGKYIFRVKAKNIYKNNSAESTYEFTILPPWYRTYWAYALYIILFFGTLYSGIKMNIRRLEAKNQELEEIVAERTKEVVHQKEVIEHKNRDIMDSINYAQGIQEAILPPDEKFKYYLPDSFILFMPRDVVSGDFYWMEVCNPQSSQETAKFSSTAFSSPPEKTLTGISGETENQNKGNQGIPKVLFAVCDCTGHGVPGGFVSMVGQNGLRRAVNEQGLSQPAQILDSVSLIVEEAFRKGKRKDGMDATLCSIRKNEKDNQSTYLEYSAANNPLYLVRSKKDGLLAEITGESEMILKPDVETETHYLFHLDPDKQPLGAYDYRKPFSNHQFLLKRGDTVYLSSDGFRDQFGGLKGKKYMAKNFKQVLVSIQDKSMDEQITFLQKNIQAWMGNNEQNDDICVIGVRV